MITRVLGRATAATATAALFLAPMGLLAGTQVAPAACSYQPENTTATTLSLRKSIAMFGAHNRAFVRVTSGGGTPSGSVVIATRGRPGTRQLDANGRATTAINRKLRAGATYTIRASFDGDCTYGPSDSDTKFYTVVKAKTRTAPFVVKARKAKFSMKVTGAMGLHPQAGRVRFKVFKGHKLVRVGSTHVRHHRAAVNLPNLHKKGRYRVKVIYFGNKNFRRSSHIRFFHVR